MLVKIHNSYRTIVAICDSNLIGKKFEEEKTSINIGENFFGGEEKTEKEVLNIIEQYSAEDATFNIVGEKSVNIALKAGIIEKQGIKNINSIPVALVLL